VHDTVDLLHRPDGEATAPHGKGFRRKTGGPFVIRSAGAFRHYNDTLNADRAKAQAKQSAARPAARTRRSSSPKRRGRTGIKTDLKLSFIALLAAAMLYGLGHLIR
jgi:hypothetical protein